MRTLLTAVLVTALAGVLAATALASTRTVKVGDNYFVRSGTPPTVTVSKGTKVTFRWVGDVVHNVHAYKGPARFKSAIKASGTFSRVLKRSGTYTLRCDVHPDRMRMTLKVR